MKKVTQKVLSLLLSVAMLFGMAQGAAVHAFAEIIASVSVGGVAVTDSNWYAKTDANGTVTPCTEADDWNIHVAEDSGPPSTATVTQKNATIANPSFNAPAIGVAGCNLNIVLDGTANRIGTGAENSNGYAIYSQTTNDIKITGEGDLMLKGYYGIKVEGSGAVKIDTTGSLSIISKWDMVRTDGSMTVSAKSITANGDRFDGSAVSLTATDGDIRITGNGNDGINASNAVTLAAPKGAVSISGVKYAIYSGSNGNGVKVSAKNDITMTGTVYGRAVSVASETGDVTINGYYQAIQGATTSVAVSAPQGDVKLTSGNYNVISGSGYTLAVTAHGKLDAKGPEGIQGYVSAAIKADTVRVTLTDVGYGFFGGALTITNPSSSNCSEVSVSGGGKGRHAVQSSGDVNVKANQVVIAANFDADNFYGTQAINATGNVTIGDAGIIVGEISVGTNNISKNIVLADQNGGDKSGGLDLKTSTPTQTTYYKVGDGYAFFTPASGETPAALTLHNVNLDSTMNLSNIPMTLYLDGKNEVFTIEAANAVTVSGSGSLDSYLFRNSNSAAALTVNSGAALNAWYQTTDNNSVTTNTIYGNYTVSDHYGQTVSPTTKLMLAPGAVLTLACDGYLEFYKDTPLSYMTIGAGASIVNNTHVTLPKDTTAAQIAVLPLSGTGVVRVATAYDENGCATAYDTYTNDGTELKTVSGGLDLADTEVPVSENKGYTWTKSGEGDSEVWTLALNNTCIDGDVRLPGKTVVINTEAKSVITGTIGADSGCDLNLTFTGIGSLTAHEIGGGADNDAVTVAEGANVTVIRGFSIGASGNNGGKLTVNGTLTASNDNPPTISVGQAEIGSSGVLNVSGEVGLKLGGKNGSYTNALVMKKGGQVNANCTTANVTVFTNTNKAEKENASKVIVLPDGYLPDGYEVTSVSGENGGQTQYAYTIATKGANLTLKAEQVTGTGAGAGGKLALEKPAATVSNVTVTPSTVSVQKGNFQTFGAVVTGTNEPSQAVTWSVSGSQSHSTAIDQSGKLTVAVDETASTLTVKAVPIDDTAKYGMATVTVPGSGNSSSSPIPSLPSVLTDAATKVTVNLSGASFPSSVTSAALSVTPVARNSTADPKGASIYPASEADAKLNVIGTSAVYNIRLLDQNSNRITGFTGAVKVRIPLPAGLRSTPRMFRYESDGTFTDTKTAVENGFLTFSTDRFGYYAIAGTGDSIILDTTSYHMPVNGNYQIGVKLTGSKAASMKFRSTNGKTATVTKLKNGNYLVTGKKPGTAYIMFDVYDNKNKFLTHASVRVDVKTGIRPRGDSTRQYGVY